MSQPRERICLNCGERHINDHCLCGSGRWELSGFRQYCTVSGCSLTEGHLGDHVPWPLKREPLPGSSADYAPGIHPKESD